MLIYNISSIECFFLSFIIARYGLKSAKQIIFLAFQNKNNSDDTLCKTIQVEAYTIEYKRCLQITLDPQGKYMQLVWSVRLSLAISLFGSLIKMRWYPFSCYTNNLQVINFEFTAYKLRQVFYHHKILHQLHLKNIYRSPSFGLYTSFGSIIFSINRHGGHVLHGPKTYILIFCTISQRIFMPFSLKFVKLVSERFKIANSNT